MNAMQPDATALLACLFIAAIGILRLAMGVGRTRRWRDPTRFFSWGQKQQLILQANGRCEHTPPLWFRCAAPGTEADHVHPWSRGGPTELWNGQLLCRRHNRRKSNRVPSPLYRRRLARRRKRY
ncbi:HNH endonuclease [Streptomyces sp. MBT57]|nr:HNH endonuclease [Streptomyces sp. MBT57]